MSAMREGGLRRDGVALRYVEWSPEDPRGAPPAAIAAEVEALG